MGFAVFSPKPFKEFYAVMNKEADTLNTAQQEAVMLGNRHALIIAGAGSGKTKTLTHRIAYLLAKKHVRPQELLALTFTNKAAAEMRERLRKLVPEAENVTMSTFHGFCLGFLKKHGTLVGLRNNFIIYDASDQEETAAEIYTELGLKEFGLFTPKDALAAVSRAKNTGKTRQDFEAARQNLREQLLGKFFAAYTERLSLRNVVDFDDLLLLTLAALKQYGERIKDTYAYVLVDEYQDTNPVQYDLLRIFAARGAKLFAVGDDDQSIYAWRGADIQNILNFRRDFPDSQVITLTQNYRSFAGILNLANAVISQNRGRFGKNLVSAVPGDAKPVLYEAQNEEDEMAVILQYADSWRRKHKLNWSSVAFIYRSNHHSRRIEEALRNESIPYRLIGGTHFFAREEIKTALAYLRLIRNPSDDLSFHRASGFPARGIGTATLKKLTETAVGMKSGLFDAIPYMPQTAKSSVQALYAFHDLITSAADEFQRLPLSQAAKNLYRKIGLEQAIGQSAQSEEVAERKIKNFHELIQSLYTFERRGAQDPLAAFLDYVMLFQMQDETDTTDNKAVLLTAHSAKGLEFDCVCLCGLTDESFPNPRAVDEGSVEEERRLFYVAMTRARRMLLLSYPRRRTVYGKTKPVSPSRFFENIPESLFARNTNAVRLTSDEREQQRISDRENFFRQFNLNPNNP